MGWGLLWVGVGVIWVVGVVIWLLVVWVVLFGFAYVVFGGLFVWGVVYTVLGVVLGCLLVGMLAVNTPMVNIVYYIMLVFSFACCLGCVWLLVGWGLSLEWFDVYNVVDLFVWVCVLVGWGGCLCFGVYYIVCWFCLSGCIGWVVWVWCLFGVVV